MQLPDRRWPVHLPARERFGEPVIIFLTVCSFRRRPVLANRPMVRAILAAWRTADAWAVGRWVVMPDHLHCFCAPRRDIELGGWIRFWKSTVTRTGPHPAPLWQASFWDTQIRRRESYADKWDYVRANPVRRGLVAAADDWPHQGELNRLEW